MNNKRIALKGRPFSRLTDEKLKEYQEMFQDFIGCFKYEDKDKEKLMQEVWKLLSDEEVDRWSTQKVITEEPKKTEVFPKLKVRHLIKRR